MAYSGDGTGVEGDPYIITTASQLQEIYDFPTAWWELGNDIDASESRYWDQGTGAYASYFYGYLPPAGFSGTFDGKNHRISGLYINRTLANGSAGYSSVGLFGAGDHDNGEFVKDFILENIDFTGQVKVGGLYAWPDGVVTTNFTISGVTVSGSIQVISGYGTSDGHAGGLVGLADMVTIENCSTSVTVTRITDGDFICYAGGFAGRLADCLVSNCKSYGNVVLEYNATASTVRAGGFVGQFGATDDPTDSISECSASGAVSVTVTTTGIIYAGGFVGAHNISGSIGDSFAKGDVSSLSIAKAEIGGFIGICSKTIARCSAEGDVENSSTNDTTNAAGGFAGSHSTSTISNCYAKGSVCLDGIGHANARIGGFVGTVGTNGAITYSYAAGAVFSTGTPTNGGGFSGYVSGGPTQTALFWDTETSGWATDNGSATGKTTTEMKTESTFTAVGWDFETVWYLSAYTRTPGNGNQVWLSKSSDYDNFEEGVNDDDSFSLVVPTTNQIFWNEALESLLIGTAGDEWKIESNKLNTPLGPKNFTIKQQSSYGSKNAQPIQINDVILYIDFVSRKIREMVYSAETEKYVSPDLTSLAEHITQSGVVCTAFQRNPDSIVWCVLADGSLISMVYDREHNVVAWSRHPIDGLVQSVCVTPGATEDEVWLSVQRTIGAEESEEEVIYIEKMAPREFDAIEDCFFVDCGISFTPQLLTLDSAPTPAAWSVGATITGDTSGTTAQIIKVRTSTTYEIAYLTGDFTDGEVISDGTNSRDCGTGYPTVADTTSATLGGLLHLIGKTVTVLGADGIEYTPTAVVNANGLITITASVAGAQIGLPFEYNLKPMRIVFEGPGGSSMGSITKVDELVLCFLNSLDVKYGTSASNLLDVPFTDTRWENEKLIDDLFTGDVRLAMPGGFSVQNPILISGDGPYPCCLKAIVAKVAVTGK